MSQAQSILKALRQVCGSDEPGQPIALHEPDFSGTQAWAYVRDCLDSGWVSTAGQWVSRFEQELCSRTGAAHAVAVTNGTVALRLALHLVGVSADDEVLLPPLSFVATANAVAHLGAVPHFVDVEAGSLGMDPTALSARLEAVAERREGGVFNRSTGRRLAVVLPVHVFGHPARIQELRAVAEAWGLPLVEDAAEALGSWLDGTHCGLFGAVGTLSFNGNKLITTGGGGALLTQSAELAQRARHLSTTAKLPHPWAFEHDAVGWNDRLPNLNAALGVAQLKDLERRLEACLEEAAERQLVADVPVGVFLSGGLDSGTLTALVAKRSEVVRTFSVGFRDDDGVVYFLYHFTKNSSLRRRRRRRRRRVVFIVMLFCLFAPRTS